MDIGIGLPNTVPATTGAELLEWARRADAAGFSSLASIGAVAYPGYEELTTFAAAAAVTERVRLFSNVLIAPTRSAAELAKQTASVDQLSGGRLTLGLAVGWRQTDFELTDRDYRGRGRGFDALLADLHKAWSGEPLVEGTPPVSPAPVQEGGIPIMIGGTSVAAVRRVVEHGIGWTAGGMPPDAVAGKAEEVRAAWRDAGRDGNPRIAALVYFALGSDNVHERSRAYLIDYYLPMGNETAEMIADSCLRTPEAISSAVEAFRRVGVDELLLDPTVSDPDQVHRLAEIVL